MKKIIFKEDENNTIIITGTASEAEALSIFLGGYYFKEGRK
jgi:hypothetical protein